LIPTITADYSVIPEISSIVVKRETVVRMQLAVSASDRNRSLPALPYFSFPFDVNGLTDKPSVARPGNAGMLWPELLPVCLGLKYV